MRTKKLLPSRKIPTLCNFMRSSVWCKTRGVNRRAEESVVDHNKAFFIIIFGNYYAALKIVTYVMSHTGKYVAKN